MTTATHNYGWLMPDPGGSANTWGNTLNGTTQAIDTKVQTLNNQVSPNTLTVARGPDGVSSGVINFQNNGGLLSRWQMGVDPETESGGNAGSNFALYAYSDTGAFLGTAFEAVRSTQTVSFPQAVTVGGGMSVTGALTANGGLTVVGSVATSSTFSSYGVTSLNGSVAAQAAAGNDALFLMANSAGANQGYLQWRHADNAVVFVNQNGGGAFWITSDGAAHTSSNLGVGGGVTTNGITATGAVTVGSTLGVSGAATFNSAATFTSTLAVSGTVGFSSALNLTGAASFNSTLNVTGAATLGPVSSSLGYRCKGGISGPFVGSSFNINWDGTHAGLWIDASFIGTIAFASTYEAALDEANARIKTLEDRLAALEARVT